MKFKPAVLILIPVLASAWWLQSRAQDSIHALSLGGKHAGLTWTVLQATSDTLEAPKNQPGKVVFLWPKQAKLLGSKWLQPTVRVGFRIAAPFQKVFAARHKQLLAQGFVPLEQTVGEQEAQATYQREARRLKLRLELLEPNTYRSSFELQ